MAKTRLLAIEPKSLPVHIGSGYPYPHSRPCVNREKRILGDAFDLSDFGVNIVRLPAGAWSSHRHWHSIEDEFIYILQGNPTLVTDAGEDELKPGLCVGFKAGDANGHHLVNHTDRDVVYLEIGSRREGDQVDYSDIDMQIKSHNDGFLHKDGSPYS